MLLLGVRGYEWLKKNRYSLNDAWQRAPRLVDSADEGDPLALLRRVRMKICGECQRHSLRIGRSVATWKADTEVSQWRSESAAVESLRRELWTG